MDRPIATQEQRKKNIGRILRWAGLVAVLVVAFLLFRQLLNTRASKDDFRIAKVEKGSIESAISASGQVIPSFEQQINSPISTEIKEVFQTSGAKVETGALILELDDEFTRLEVESTQDELSLKKNNVARLKLEFDKNLRELGYNSEIKALEVSSLEAQLADARRLKELGSATQEEVEKAELALQIAQLEKKKLENDLDFRKAVVEKDRQNLELEVNIQEKKLRELDRKLQQTRVKAPRSGVITWVNENIGQKVNEGEALARIADLKSFRIEASCSDRYTSQIKTGMPVKVRINQSNLNGTINAILPTVENNTLAFTVALDQPDHPALRPNMQVEVFAVTDYKEEALRVPNGPVFSGSIQQDVFVIRGDRAVKQRVRIGLMSKEYIEILPGSLQAGDRIIISDMQDYDHLDQIELK